MVMKHLVRTEPILCIRFLYPDQYRGESFPEPVIPLDNPISFTAAGEDLNVPGVYSDVWTGTRPDGTGWDVCSAGCVTLTCHAWSTASVGDLGNPNNGFHGRFNVTHTAWTTSAPSLCSGQFTLDHAVILKHLYCFEQWREWISLSAQRTKLKAP